MKIITITGYKPLEMNIYKHDDVRIHFIKYTIKKRLIEMIEEGLEWVIISGQMGVELWAAEVVLDLKDEYDIHIGIFPPFENQTSRWPEPFQLLYDELTLTADFYQPIYKGDYKGPYQFRASNMWLADKSDACLLLMDADYPGSVRYFYEQAKQTENYPIFMITPDDLDDAVTELQMQDPEYWN